MLLSIAAIVAGLILLIWSADKFVEGAAAIADHLGVSALIIGITIIGFGTSAPEILVSIIAVYEDTPDIAIGNALGSNIANIGLILGITAILVPVPIAHGVIKSEFLLLIIATAVMVWCLYDLTVSHFDGFLMMGLLIVILAYLIKSHSKPGDSTDNGEPGLEIDIPDLSNAAAWGWVLVGLVVLVTSSKMLVWGATNVAHALGVSELIIGLTIIALGTSLPELAASIASLKKSSPDLAVGNIIGSNLFNSLAVIGFPATYSSFTINSSAVSRDLPVAVGITLLLLVLARFPVSGAQFLGRFKGIMLLTCFVLYQLYLYYEVAIAIA